MSIETQLETVQIPVIDKKSRIVLTGTTSDLRPALRARMLDCVLVLCCALCFAVLVRAPHCAHPSSISESAAEIGTVNLHLVNYRWVAKLG